MVLDQLSFTAAALASGAAAAFLVAEAESEQRHDEYLERARQQAEARTELERAIRAVPDRASCNRELERMQAKEQWHESRALMQLIGRAGLPADVGRYNALILWCKKSKQWSDALSLLDEMRAAGTKPSVVSFNSIIDACGKAGQLEVAVGLLDRMAAEGLAADAVTYTSLIDAFGKAQQLDRAFQLLGQMFIAGVRPDAFTYWALIAACAEGCDADRAFAMLRQMEAEGVKLSLQPETPYLVVITAFIDNKQLDGALKVLQMMRDSRLQPPSLIYMELIDACLQTPSGGLERAFRLLQQMREEGLEVDLETYHLLILACGEARETGKAFEVLRMMKDASVVANSDTYDALINACAEGSEADRAFDVLRQMEAEGVKPSTTTYALLISACGRAQQLERAFSVMSDMERLGVGPDAVCYISLIYACGRAQQIGTALQVFDQMKRSGVTPTRATYTALMSTCSQCGEPDRAASLHEEMVRHLGPGPPLVAKTEAATRLASAHRGRQARKAVASLRGLTKSFEKLMSSAEEARQAEAERSERAARLLARQRQAGFQAYAQMMPQATAWTASGEQRRYELQLLLMTGPEMKAKVSDHLWRTFTTAGLQRQEARAILHHLQMIPEVPPQARVFIGLLAGRVDSYGDPTDEECTA